MTTPEPPAPPAEAGVPPSTPLGRAWIGPGLLAAGVLTLARIEVLAALAAWHRGIDEELARWAALGELPQVAVQCLVLGVVGAVLVASAGGARRFTGFVLAGLLYLSATSGWPVADAEEIATAGAPGLARLPLLVALAFAEAAVVAGIVLVAARSAGAKSFLEARPVLVAFALVGLGLPGWVLSRDAHREPTMPVREVVAELVGTPERWTIVRRAEEAKALPPVITPFVDWRLTAAEHDTGDKPALNLPPPSEVSFTVDEREGVVDLVAAAQIDFELTHRWPDAEGNDTPSPLDGLGADHVAVRFEVLVDGRSVFDEVIVHRRRGDTGESREWRHVGEGGKLPLEPGQTVTLRTSFGDEETERFWGAHPFGFRCGFGDLVLERWHRRPRQRATPEQPNLVLVVMDTLRADRMSCYGYEKPTTPYADALAARGMLFENAFATSSWTWPSTASLLTGLLPYEHGVISNSACNLGLSYETVAEVLQGRGYTTAAISCNPLIDRDRHFDQGFETFDCAARMRMSDEVIEEIEETLDRVAGSRFFLYLQLVDPHTPHRPLASELARLGGTAPPDYPDEVRLGMEVDGLDHYAQLLNGGAGRDPDGTPHPDRVIPEAHRQWMSDRYDASVGTGDHFLGRILDRLERLGLTGKTIVVFTADHGEELLDHDMLEHGHALWKELVHVPLILAGPGLPEGVRVTTEVSNRHVAPTLAILGGGVLSRVGDARNLLEEGLAPMPIFSATEKGYWNGHKGLQLLGWREGEYVTHYAPKGGDWGQPAAPGGQVRIFDVEDDPRERYDLATIPERRAAIASESVPRVVKCREEQLERKVGIDVPVGGAPLPPGYTGDDEGPRGLRGGARGEKDESKQREDSE